MKNLKLSALLLFLLCLISCSESVDNDVPNPEPLPLSGNFTVISNQGLIPSAGGTYIRNYSFDLSIGNDTSLMINNLVDGRLFDGITTDLARKGDKIYLLRNFETIMDVVTLGSDSIEQSIDYSAATTVIRSGKRLLIDDQRAILSGLNDFGQPFLIEINLTNQALDSIPLPTDYSFIVNLGLADGKIFFSNSEFDLIVLDANSFQEVQRFANFGALGDFFETSQRQLLAAYSSSYIIDPVSVTISDTLPTPVATLTGRSGFSKAQSSGFDQDENKLYYLSNLPQPGIAFYVMSVFDFNTMEETDLIQSIGTIDIDVHTVAFDSVNNLFYLGGGSSDRGYVRIYDTGGNLLRELSVEGSPIRIIPY